MNSDSNSFSKALGVFTNPEFRVKIALFAAVEGSAAGSPVLAQKLEIRLPSMKPCECWCLINAPLTLTLLFSDVLIG